MPSMKDRFETIMNDQRAAAFDQEDNVRAARPDGEVRAEAEDAFLAELGRRVRTMRGLRGMSRKTLSRVSGISERYIAQLEAGHGNVSIILLRRVSSAMGAKIEDLISSADVNPVWALFRDLLHKADPALIVRAKAILSGTGSHDRLRANKSSTPHGVALIGLRGGGKSTLGRILAERLGWPFVELNKRIEGENGLSVAEIMALYGQEGFRRLEQSALRNLLDAEGPVVLATGGGIVAEPITFDLILSSFYTIWLKARPEEHMDRVRNQGDLRPMADDRFAMQELRTILLSREPHYARAAAIVDTSGLTVAESGERLFECAKKALPEINRNEALNTNPT
jgi:XRE family transcriptional regulator, aerobic/anaerobic benzoate catabolism transcriptional regulator